MLLSWMEREMARHEMSAKERGVAVVPYDPKFSALQAAAERVRGNPFERIRASL
jgi:hypothetical protein